MTAAGKKAKALGWSVKRSNARANTHRGKLNTRPKTQPMTKLRTADVVPLLLPLVDMDRTQCRYPYDGIDGSGYLFCGHPRQEGSSYCPGHHRLCWQEPVRIRKSNWEIA